MTGGFSRASGSASCFENLCYWAEEWLLTRLKPSVEPGGCGVFGPRKLKPIYFDVPLLPFSPNCRWYQILVGFLVVWCCSLWGTVVLIRVIAEYVLGRLCFVTRNLGF